MALVSPSNKPLRHPLNEFTRCWKQCTKQEQAEFDFEPWRSDYESFLDLLCNSGECVDIHNPGRKTGCNCMGELDLTEGELNSLMNYLFRYARMSWEEQRSLVLEWKRHANLLRFCDNDPSARGQVNVKTVYLLPGSSTHIICKNAIARLVGKSRFAWDSIGKEGKEEHGLTKRQTGNRSISEKTMDSLHEYFAGLNALGAPRATRIVTDLSADKTTVNTELKDADTELVELPACHSKRALYRSYLDSVGWTLAFDSKSRKV